MYKGGLEMKIGYRINELRYSNNMSQTDLAEKLQVSRQAVCSWETDKRNPPLDTIIALAKLFHTSTDYLLGLSSESSESTFETVYSGREENLLNAFRKLDIDNQDIIIGEVKKLIKEQQNNNQVQALKKVP